MPYSNAQRVSKPGKRLTKNHNLVCSYKRSSYLKSLISLQRVVRTCEVQACPPSERRYQENEHIWVMIELVDHGHSFA